MFEPRWMHEEIYAIISDITTHLSKETAEEIAGDLARNINTLAGKLRVHLNAEDNFLYPAYKDSSNYELRRITIRYMEGMPEISDKFMEYKNKYNTGHGPCLKI